MELLLWIIIGVMFGAASMAVAPEGKQGLAFLLGLLFGPIGLLVSVLMSKQ